MNVKRLQNDFDARLKRTRMLVFVAFIGAVAAVALPASLALGLDYSSFQIITQRNIFDQSRTPPGHGNEHPAPRIADSFALVGTLFYARGDIAFFDGTSPEYQKALRVGGDIAGFKVTAVTLNSVTLSDGTNQTVLKITRQMRRDNDGHWAVSTEPVSYSSAGGLSDSTSGRTNLRRSRRYNSNRGNAMVMTRTTAAGESPAMEMEGNTPNTSAPPNAASANSALERLMQRRAQEEQRIRQGQ
jgi:hypothetical protein